LPPSALEPEQPPEASLLENPLETPKVTDVVAEVKPKPPKSKPKPVPAARPKTPVYLRRAAPRLPSKWAALRQTAALSSHSSAALALLSKENTEHIGLITPTQETTQPSQTDVAQLSNPEESVMQLKRIVEAILFAAGKPMSVKQIQQVFPELEQPEMPAIQTAIEAISQDYADRPVGLIHLASGYRFQVKEGMAYWVSRLFEEKPPRYSRALLETLAIIAYRQPVTRGEIEDIRGVSVSSGIIQTLLEREWIRVIAHKESPGRPALYGTTKQFLDYFNLNALTELPTLEDLLNHGIEYASEQQTQQEHRERAQTHLSETHLSQTFGQETGQTQNQTDAKNSDA